MELYREQLVARYQTPKYKGIIEGADYSAQEQNTHCGDTLTLYLKFGGGVITQAGYEASGCLISQVSADLLCEKLVGMNINKVRKLNQADIEKMLGVTLTPARLGCALLPLEALRSALP